VRAAFHRAFKTLQPDVIFATWAYPDGWAAIRLAHSVGLPVVLKVHGSDLLQLDAFPSRKRGTMEALTQADRIIAVSQDLRRNAIELGADADNVRLIYNGVDPLVFKAGSRMEARRKLGLDPTRPVLLFIGNLLPVKGIDILLQSCALLKRSDFDFELHIIGRGPLQGQIEKQIETEHLQDRVRLQGSIPNDHLADWYRAASLFVLPSRSEGVPNVLLEAAACGTPFVASNVGGIPEIAHLGSSRLFEVEDINGLASSIRAKLMDGTLDTQVKPAARTHGDAARELIAVFEEVIAEHSTRMRASPSQRINDGVICR
jgi:glycosyltransferase involved in cell wall biosynthesis